MNAPNSPLVTRTGFRGRPRRSWPQRLLLVLGVVAAGGFFATAQFFWEARAVLAELPRIAVGADVLAQTGAPGGPVNVLLVGVDSSEGLDPDDPVLDGRNVEDEARGVVRSDTILILRLDPATGRASVMSLPRDLIVVAPGGNTTRINATQTVGGIGSLVTTIDENFSIPINHFVVADFAGFAEIVEIVGGVPVYFPYPTRDLGSRLSLPEAGCWSLDGSESLAYVRARSLEELIDGEWVKLGGPTPDLARIERQQEFMVLALEQVLEVGRSDISRIGEFIEAGTQAVQLDEALTPGDMLDLASAFADYDTAALNVATIPVAPEFSEDGRYLGEAVQQDEASELLAIFQGAADGVRPETVSVQVASADDVHREQLVERGFDAVTVEAEPVAATRVTFDPSQREQALLLARYLVGVPRLEAEPGSTLQLRVGTDFAGVREFPRPVADIEPGLDQAIRRALDALPPQLTSTTVAPEPENPTTTSFANTTNSDLPSTSGPQGADVPKDPKSSSDPGSTLVVRGRPPVDVQCGPTGG